MWGAGWRGAVTACVALLVLLVGAGLLRAGLSGDDPAPPRADRSTAHATATETSSPGPRTVGSRHRGVPDLTRGLVLPESRPVRLSIPRLGVTSRLEDLGVDAAGAMEVPGDPARAGWYDRGPAPGSLGPAVVAGHVTWNGTRAVFYRLATLRRGDLVRVTRTDGRVAVFAVRRVAQFEKTRFPTRAVYGAIDHAGLRLITCGGTYDAQRHRYLANVVVFADLVRAGRPDGQQRDLSAR
jgi:hypothetical protein